jgi:O-acetyl-ADP-ribose deacetylase (regulator of RNase III)
MFSSIWQRGSSFDKGEDGEEEEETSFKFSKLSLRDKDEDAKRAKMWRDEEALDLSQRRARYKCGKDFVEVNEIVRWKDYKTVNTATAKEKASENPVRAKWFIKTFNIDQKEDIASRWTYNEELNSKVAIWHGDIRRLEVDAIVNAANEACLGGGGIDGAIHHGAGPKLLAECSLLHGCPRGKAKITRAYNLPAKYVIHTVGPIGENPDALHSCYKSVLKLAVKHNIKSLVFCGISTGIYGYPLYAASHIALATVRTWLDKPRNNKKIDLIVFCTFLEKEKTCYESLMPMYFPRDAPQDNDIPKKGTRSFL